MTIEFQILCLGALFTLLVIYRAEPIARQLGVMDHPGGQDHKKHHRATPLVGGIASIPPVAAVLVTGFAFSAYRAEHGLAMLAMAFATAMSFLVGLTDDRQHIPALRRLVLCGSVFVCTILIAPEFSVSALDFQSVGVTTDLGALSIPFSALCLLALQNSVNMSDGRNGLVSGLCILWLSTLLSYGPHPLSTALLSLLCGLIIVFVANMRGHIFLGDAGTYGIGAFIGLAIIWMHRSNIGLQTLDVAVILAVPILDMLRLFAFRLANGSSPFKADHDHLHHYLDDSIGWNRGLYVYLAMQILPIIAVRLNLAPKIAVFVCVCLLYLGTLVACRMRIAARRMA